MKRLNSRRRYDTVWNWKEKVYRYSEKRVGDFGTRYEFQDLWQEGMKGFESEREREY